MHQYQGFECYNLDNNHQIYRSSLPQELIPNEEVFEKIWKLHPAEFHEIVMHGQKIATPRWEQAYNRSYNYARNVNQALEVPSLVQPFWKWVQQNINSQLNGILLNWYDSRLDHYIGKHRDSTKGLVAGTPIVTISLGERRKFRFRPFGGKGYQDFFTGNGVVFIVPYDTNLAWTHEITKEKKLQGKRISITIRAFV